LKGIAILLTGALVLLACSSAEPADDDDEGGGNASGYCGTLEARLRECGVLGTGRFECVNYSDPAERCETACLAEASCGGVTDFYCSYTGSVPRCFEECVGLVPFPCDDGLTIDAFAQCNGVEECLDGEDELDCAVIGRYKCRNVDAFVDVALYCDGVEDCSDGSDETPGCAPDFDCGDGISLAEYSICDGTPQCSDGSDEASDCAVATCS